jgi:hypothetical protein
MSRLVLDFIWRSRWWYLFGMVQLGLAWATVGQGDSLHNFVAGTMLAAFYVGPIQTFLRWPTREYGTLPLSRLELWRARWLLAVAVPVMITTAARLAALVSGVFIGRQTPITNSVIVLSALWEGAYCAGFMGIATFMAYTPSRLGRIWPASTWMIKAAAVPLFLTGSFFSLPVRQYLAIRPDEFGPVTVVLLGTFVAMGSSPIRSCLIRSEVRS